MLLAEHRDEVTQQRREHRPRSYTVHPHPALQKDLLRLCKGPDDQGLFEVLVVGPLWYGVLRQPGEAGIEARRFGQSPML
ncbi:hypothetical protein D3C84_1179690 [compost metagenome]